MAPGLEAEPRDVEEIEQAIHMAKPLVFISHKHDDRDIAAKVAKWVQEATDFNMDVFLSSHEGFKGPRFGREINKELRSALWRSDALILIYTTDDREWSYCMWECGVANDASSPETTVIVFQFSDDVPRVLGGTNLVDARKPADIRRFTSQFFTDPEFFPSLNGALKPNLPVEVINAKADLLFAELKDRPDFSAQRDWPTWPCMEIELSIGEVAQLKGLARAEGVTAVAKSARVTACDPKALNVFGLTNLTPGTKFTSIMQKDNAASELPPWFVACCEQIFVSATDGLPHLSWRAIEKGHSEYIPAVSRVRQRPSDATVQFDVYFYDLPPRDSEDVTERMLTPERFFWRCLDESRPAAVHLVELNRDLRRQGKNRVPFLTAAMCPKYIVHRSVITDFLADNGADEKSTLQDLLANPEQRQLIEQSFATVDPSATLADAAAAMRRIARCRDVFVTTDGTRDTPVHGWLTNLDLESRPDPLARRPAP